MGLFVKPNIDGFTRNIESNIGNNRVQKQNVAVNPPRDFKQDSLGDVLNDYDRRLQGVRQTINFLRAVAIRRTPRTPLQSPINDLVVNLTGSSDPDLDCIYQVAVYDGSTNATETVTNFNERVDQISTDAQKIQPIKFGLEFLWLLIRLTFAVIIHGTIGYMCWWIPAKLVIPIPILNELPKTIGFALGKLERILLESRLIDFSCIYRDITTQKVLDKEVVQMNATRIKISDLQYELEQLQNPLGVSGRQVGVATPPNPTRVATDIDSLGLNPNRANVGGLGLTSITTQQQEDINNRIIQIRSQIVQLNNDVLQECVSADKFQVVFPCCSKSPFEILQEDPCLNEYIKRESRRQVCPGKRIPYCAPGWEAFPLYDSNGKSIIENAPCYLDILDAQQIIQAISRSGNNLTENGETSETDLTGLIQQYLALDKSVTSVGKTLSELQALHNGQTRGLDEKVGCGKSDYTGDIVKLVRFMIIPKNDIGRLIHLYAYTKDNLDRGDDNDFLAIMDSISSIAIVERLEDVLNSNRIEPEDFAKVLNTTAIELGRPDIFSSEAIAVQGIPVSSVRTIEILANYVDTVSFKFTNKIKGLVQSVKNMKVLFEDNNSDKLKNYDIKNKTYTHTLKNGDSFIFHIFDDINKANQPKVTARVSGGDLEELEDLFAIIEQPTSTDAKKLTIIPRLCIDDNYKEVANIVGNDLVKDSTNNPNSAIFTFASTDKSDDKDVSEEYAQTFLTDLLLMMNSKDLIRVGCDREDSTNKILNNSSKDGQLTNQFFYYEQKTTDGCEGNRFSLGDITTALDKTMAWLETEAGLLYKDLTKFRDKACCIVLSIMIIAEILPQFWDRGIDFIIEIYKKSIDASLITWNAALEINNIIGTGDFIHPKLSTDLPSEQLTPQNPDFDIPGLEQTQNEVQTQNQEFQEASNDKIENFERRGTKWLEDLKIYDETSVIVFTAFPELGRDFTIPSADDVIMDPSIHASIDLTVTTFQKNNMGSLPMPIGLSEGRFRFPAGPQFAIFRDSNAIAKKYGIDIFSANNYIDNGHFRGQYLIFDLRRNEGINRTPARYASDIADKYFLGDVGFSLVGDIKDQLDTNKRDNLLSRTVSFLEMVIAVLETLKATRKNNLFELLGFIFPLGDMLAVIADQIARVIAMALDVLLRPLTMSFDIILESKSWQLFKEECPQANMIPNLAFGFNVELGGQLIKKVKDWITGLSENIVLWEDIVIKRDEFEWLCSFINFLKLTLDFLQKIGHCFDIENINKEMTQGVLANNAQEVILFDDIINNPPATIPPDEDPVVRSRRIRRLTSIGRTLEQIQINDDIQLSVTVPEISSRLRQYKELLNNPNFNDSGNLDNIIQLLPPTFKNILRSAEGSMSDAVRGLFKSVQGGPFNSISDAQVTDIQRILNIGENQK